METADPAPSPQPREVTPQTRVGEIMTRSVVTTRPEALVVDIVRLMARNKITGLPVVDSSNRLIGVVSESDIIGKTGDSVEDIMTNGSWPVNEDTTLGDAAEVMLRRRIRRLPVVRGDNELIGLLSRSDLITFFASHVWTCSWCAKGFRGFYAPSVCTNCGGETFTIQAEEPA
ncbi:MAG: CBS domain-containing protein [Candidatus Dormibacteria bacterium]